MAKGEGVPPGPEGKKLTFHLAELRPSLISRLPPLGSSLQQIYERSGPVKAPQSFVPRYSNFALRPSRLRSRQAPLAFALATVLHSLHPQSGFKGIEQLPNADELPILQLLLEPHVLGGFGFMSRIHPRPIWLWFPQHRVRSPLQTKFPRRKKAPAQVHEILQIHHPRQTYQSHDLFLLRAPDSEAP